MPRTLTTLMLPPGANVEGRRVGAFAGAAKSVAIADNAAYVQFQTGEQINTPRSNILCIDLLTGEGSVIARDMLDIHCLLGVLGGEPVAFTSTSKSGRLAWLLSQPNKPVELTGGFFNGTQGSDCIWIAPDEQVPWLVDCLFLDEGQLRVRTERRDRSSACMQALVDSTRERQRLPAEWQSLNAGTSFFLHMGARLLTGHSPDGDYSLTDVVRVTIGRCHLHGRTGALFFIQNNCLRRLTGIWRPALDWSPVSHADYPPTDRARALALLLCLRSACPRWLAMHVIAHSLDGAST